MKRRAPGILFIYHRPTGRGSKKLEASNVNEHLAAFGRHSQYRVWTLNTELGNWSTTFPDFGHEPDISRLEFDAIVLHYSLFLGGPDPYLIGDSQLDYLSQARGYKIAFFQDEHHWCKKRFAFIDDYGVDCVYTMLGPPFADRVYLGHSKATKTVTTLPGYVGPEPIKAARRFAKPDGQRKIDIGYRGRPGQVHSGRGALEKRVIGDGFAERASASGLVLDISTSEESRLYSDDWHRFLGNCKGTLGAESGVSCFDLTDEVLEQYLRLSSYGHEPSFEELERGAMGRWDGKIPYRTIAPRNFEGAAFRVCQILFEGQYSGVMEPMRHYIPLRKDFSNFEEVLERFRDTDLRHDLTENARRDLIDSGQYGYKSFIRGFDETLAEVGLQPNRSARESVRVRRALRRPIRNRWHRYRYKQMSYWWLHNRRMWWFCHALAAPFGSIRYRTRRLLGRAS